MNKSRVETISDGVFAIVMTLLIFDVKIPDALHVTTNTELWMALGMLWPLFVSYAFSFLVLSVFWINHHFLFHTFAKAVDRQLNLMNMVYLMFLAFVPFSAHLIGSYQTLQPAIIVYGLNILAIVLLSAGMIRYIRKNPELRNDSLSSRTKTQARIRTSLSIGSYVLGLLASFFYIPLSIALFLFPLLFNVIPGTLDLAERLFRFEIV